MACQIKFIEQSSLSEKDKLRFEEIYNESVIGMSPSEINSYELELSKQFFDTGYFDNSEDGDFFIYADEAYPYMIQEENIITSAPKDISNYILKNYNKELTSFTDRYLFDLLLIKPTNINFKVESFGKSIDNIEIFKDGVKIGYAQISKNNKFKTLNVTGIELKEKGFGKYIYLKLQGLYPDFIIKSDKTALSFDAINMWDSLVKRDLAIKIGEKDYILKNYNQVKPDSFTTENIRITSQDRIIFGHPTIGKSFLKNDGDNRFISLDDDYATEINNKVQEIATKYNITTYQVKDGGDKEWNKEYNQEMQRLFDTATQRAISENKALFTSNTNLLKNNINTFDKVINLTDEEFIKRIKDRGAKYDVTEWKSQINSAVSNVPIEKVITTNKYLSDLLPNNTVKEPTTSQRIANIDNMVSFDMNELSFLTDLLKEINPEFKIEYLEDLMLKQGIWGYADIEHFKAILDKRADKAFVSEEFCHLLLEAYNDKPFLREIGDMMIHTKLYQDEIKKYINNPEYQKDGKPWMEKIKREFVGKALGYIIAGRSVDDIIGKHPQTKGLVGMLKNLWEKIKVLFTGKLDDKLMTVLSDIKNRRGFDMESVTEFNKEIFLATTGTITLPGLDLAIDLYRDFPYYFDDVALVNEGKLTPTGELLFTMYKTFNDKNLTDILKRVIKIVDFGSLSTLNNPEHRTALEIFKTTNIPSFNGTADLNASVYFKSEQDINVNGSVMKSPEHIFFNTENPILDVMKKAFKTDITNFVNSKKETSAIEEITGLFEDTNINKFITLSELIQSYVNNLTRKNSQIPFNYLVKNKISKDVLKKARSLKGQEADIDAFATSLRFLESIDDLYAQLGELSNSALLAGVNTTESRLIFDRLKEYKDLNDQLIPLLNFFSDHIKKVKDVNNLAESFTGIVNKINNIRGNMSRFNDVIKVLIVEQIAETITDKVLSFNEKMYSHIKAIDESGSSDPLVIANRENYIKQLIGSYDADETLLRENTKNAIRNLLLGYSDTSTSAEEIKKRLSEIEGDSENALARWFDNMVLGSTNSIDWFVQAMGVIVESEKNNTMFDAQSYQHDLAKIGHLFDKYSAKEIKESLTEIITDSDGREVAVFVTNTREHRELVNKLRREKAEVKRRIDLLVGDVEADQLEFDSLEFEIKYHKETKFFGEETDSVYEYRVAMYRTLMNKFNINEEQLIKLLFQEKQDSSKIYKEEQVERRNTIEAKNNEDRLRAKNRVVKARRKQAKAFETSNERNPQFKAIREARTEFSKIFNESKPVMSWYINNVRSKLKNIPEADQRHIEEILSQPSNTEEEKRLLLLNLHGFIRDVLSLRSFSPNVKTAVNELVYFIDDTISIIGNDDFYERRSKLIAGISEVSAKLKPEDFIQVDYEKGSRDYNGKTIEYVTQEEYEALDEDDQKEVKYYLQKVNTQDGEKIFIRSAERNNFLSNNDISGLWEQILDLVKDYKLPSGEIYLDPYSREQDESGRTPSDIRREVKDLEDRIEYIKEQAKQDSDEERSPEEKALYKQLFSLLEKMGQISKDNQTPPYFEEAYEIINDNQQSTDTAFDNHWDNVRRLSDMRGFRARFQSALNDKAYIEHLLSGDNLSPIDVWVKDNHIITRTKRKNQEGEYEEGYRIKPAYYFRKILPSQNKDKKVILSKEYNHTALKDEFQLSRKDIVNNYPERLDTKGFYNSRGLSPSTKYNALMNDQSEKGRDMREIYQVLYKDIFLKAQKDSSNNNGKLEDVFPSLEKFAHEDFKGYWKRTLWSQRNQFESGLGNEPTQEVIQEEKRGWRERFFNFIAQIIKPATTRHDDYDRKNVPVFYTGWKDPKLLTNDTKTAVFAYIESLKQADSLQKNLSLVSSTIEVLKESQYNANDHRVSKLENMKKYQMRNSNQAVNGTLAKLYSLIPRIIRLTSQASWIPDTQVKNIFANFFQNVAANTTHYKPTVAPYRRALVNMKSILSAMREYKTDNKDALIYKYLNPGSESFFNRFKQDHEWIEYLASADWIAAVPALAGNYDNLTDMYRMLDVQVKVKDSDEVVSIRDAFIVTDGILSFRNDLVKVDGSPFTMQDIQNHVLAIKQIRFSRTGHHDENTPVNANFIARGVFSLARYIFPIIRNEVVNAVGGRRRNIVLNELERSRFRDTWSYILGAIYGRANNFNYSHLISNAGERRRAYSTMVLISSAGLMYLFSAMLGYHGYDDDDDKYEELEDASDFEQFMVSVFIKVNSELESSFITVNPNLLPSIIVDQRFNKPRDWVPIWSENKGIIQRNLMMNFIFKDMAQFLSGIFYQAEFTRDDRLDRWEEGDNKTKALLQKFQPIARWNERYTNAEEVVKMIEGLDKTQ